MNKVFAATLLGLTCAALLPGCAALAQEREPDLTGLHGSWTVVTMRTTGGVTHAPGFQPTRDSMRRYPGLVYTFHGDELDITDSDSRDTPRRTRLTSGPRQGRAQGFLATPDPATGPPPWMLVVRPYLADRQFQAEAAEVWGKPRWMLVERQGEWLTIAASAFEESLPRSFEPRPGLTVALLLSEVGREAREPCRVLRKAGMENWLGYVPYIGEGPVEAPVPGPACTPKALRDGQREMSLVEIFGADMAEVLLVRSQWLGAKWQPEPYLGQVAFSTLSEDGRRAGFLAFKNHTIVLLAFSGPISSLAEVREFAKRVLTQF